MKLTELEPHWVAPEGRHGQAVTFLCPKCKQVRIVIPFANPVDGGAAAPDMNALAVLWQREGDSFETLTLRPSVNFTHVNFDDDLVDKPVTCNWHGFITNGEATDC